ncbi:hypothetical protein UY3_06336 [Chelonia mydas]|uniref:Uncharacterized protein n=1 Tax=Chelonia mydas TaxID=8469 RepID=M7BEX9_CHEMY|nr:hypothetical protein UY3_06336 [Chelonia mydas]
MAADSVGHCGVLSAQSCQLNQWMHSCATTVQLHRCHPKQPPPNCRRAQKSVGAATQRPPRRGERGAAAEFPPRDTDCRPILNAASMLGKLVPGAGPGSSAVCEDKPLIRSD